MSNEIKEDIIIYLTEARNKINKSIILYEKFNQDPIYLKTIKDLLNQELQELVRKDKNASTQQKS